jgi:Protein of unknown function (DUF2585)
MTTEDRQWPAMLLASAVGLVVFQAIALWLMGRPMICTCGTIKLWHGVVKSSGNSQHLTDWYTFSHIVHGFLFYAALKFLFPAWNLWKLLVAAFAIEVAWEVIENTNFVVDRYRSETISFDYFGDSIINSVADTLAMAVGFVLAARWPVWLSVVAVLAIEFFLAYVIRDNLTLNIIMLLWPLDIIRDWQAAGAS